jgi:raffinose/stachyose/melibiose transport system substrate-binding protein
MKKVVLSATIIIFAIFLCFILFAKFQTKSIGAFFTGNKDYEEKSEQVVLHFIYWRDFPKEIFDAFSKKYPDITVQFERYDMNQFRDVQRSRILSGENIDVMGVFEKDYTDLISKGDLIDITNKEFINNYDTRAIETLKNMYNNNKIYGIPYKGRVWGVWYNQILFKKYNIEIPKNYEEFLNACKKLNSNGVPALILGARDEEISSYIFYISMMEVLNKNPSWIDKLNKGEVRWTDKEMVQAFNETDSFIKKGYLLNESIELTNQQAFSKFINGQIGMYISDDWSIDMYEDKRWDMCEPGVFPLTYNEANEKIKVPGAVASEIIGISSQSKHKKEAELLLDYLSKSETAQIYSEKMKSRTNVKSVSTEKLKYDELWQSLREMEFIKPIANSMREDVQRKLNRTAKQFIIQNIKVSEALKELQKVQEEANDADK